jgi:hypothetical protein
MSKRMLFFLAAVILAGAGLYSRAASTRTARTQADALVRADAAAAAPAQLASLKAFVGGHMGASVDFTLKGSYDRAGVAAAAAATTTTTNSQIYAAAQASCGGKSDSITQARCNQAYLFAHLANVPPPVYVPAPKLTDYQYNLRAPLWTPDLAGALLLGAALATGAGFLIGRRRSLR